VSYLNSKVVSAQGPNIQSIVRENKQFQSVLASIQQRVVGDFEKAEEHAQSYESVRPIYEFNMNWDYEEYRAQQHDVSSLKGMLEFINNWSKELEKLRNKPIGILEVDSKKLKGELNPLRDARLAEIKDYIKDIARIRCSQLLEHYKDNLNKLATKPHHLKDFANQVSIMSVMKEEEKNLYKTTSQVDQLYNLLQQNDVKVPSEDLVLHEDLHDRQSEYRTEIEVAQQYRDTKLNEMVASVDANIIKLQDQVMAAVSKLEG
jgi:hypothetical protein